MMMMRVIDYDGNAGGDGGRGVGHVDVNERDSDVTRLAQGANGRASVGDADRCSLLVLVLVWVG